MFTQKHIDNFSSHETPFYFYDLELLKNTLQKIKTSAPKNYHIHYALKANAHPTLLEIIRNAGLGADCVSGNEVKRALECNFKNSDIAFAGVGKSDKEINFALDNSIFCFNVESVHELKVINELAKNKSTKANIALRINPNVDAYTHKYITTGLEENKFGINPYEFDQVLDVLKNLENINFTGLHFHIGSQIQDLTPFKNLCLRANEINKWFIQKGYLLPHINLGGGLGIDYQNPDANSIPDFEKYFAIFKQFLELQPSQEIHFELGRSIIAQCGSLISRVLYIKNGINTNFAILDAGMTELIRPALYQAYHKIENISKLELPNSTKYDVVGPICESSDCFGKAVEMPLTERGDIIAIRSAGAYGEVMSNHYNLRDQVKSVFM
ncbi:MAG: diaminopimelate decarboxylase [Bacteroidota bacterium]|nr:diaminopimelate decarboxylase [Bacteroidota bacterium]MDP3143895.1 diaminopimelate decarboxylase [Bacteroidota bacterium]MDP3558043.1 diaminopimelate decarboxylase [Bacteroidota bacterium]